MAELTNEALASLRETHEKGCHAIKRSGFQPEPVDVAIEVERHRWYWRPRRPKLLLLAESHVLTSEQDMVYKTEQTQLQRFLCPGAPPQPDHFVRLVYCLAYGEPDLIQGPSLPLSNPGTPPYWDILGRVAFRCPQPRHEDGMEFDDRMRWKIDTLRQLYRMGIWLLDASVHAIYRCNKLRLPKEIQALLHEQWLEGYGRHVIELCEFPPVWVIGKMVHDCLGQSQSLNCRGWIYQPNAKGYDLNRNWSGLLEDCCALRTEL